MTRMTRRHALALFAAGALSLPSLSPAFAQGVAGRKFIFVLLRGGLDGLATLVPDDPALNALRGDIVPALSDHHAIGQGFALHPGLSGLAQMYRTGDAAFIHAAATGYRDRSHFDGQDVLETLAGPGERTGWLNRTLIASGGTGLAIGYALPLVLQGQATVRNWAPPVFAPAQEDLLARLGSLYTTDAVFAEALASAQAMPAPEVEMGQQQRNPAAQYRDTLSALGQFMAAEDGPGVGVVSLEGWDTHANQMGVLQTRLSGLDAGLEALKTALGTTWSSTCVVVCSEFGRTAAMNGTRGTDHGTGGLVMLLGGAVAGGRIFGDWPGLQTRALHERRDVAPANDVAAILKGVLRDHLGIDRARLDREIFPSAPRPMEGLIGSA